MIFSRHVIVRGAALAFAIVTGGRALAQEQPLMQTVTGGPERTQRSRVALTWVRPETNLAKYRTIMLKPLAVPADARSAAPFENAAASGESSMLSSGAVAQLQNAFAASMKNALGSAGYTFVNTPQADTLVVAPLLVKASEGGGAITVAAVLADGSSGEVIAEARDRKYGSEIRGIDNGTADVAEAGDAFDQWADDLRNTLQAGPTSQHPLIMPITGHPDLDVSGATAP